MAEFPLRDVLTVRVPETPGCRGVSGASAGLLIGGVGVDQALVEATLLLAVAALALGGSGVLAYLTGAYWRAIPPRDRVLGLLGVLGLLVASGGCVLLLVSRLGR